MSYNLRPDININPFEHAETTEVQLKQFTAMCSAKSRLTVTLTIATMFIWKNQMYKMGPWNLGSFSKLTYSRYDYACIIYDMHMNSIRIHPNVVADINKEKNIKYGLQTETSGDSDRQNMIV